jgi:hypothetical protein
LFIAGETASNFSNINENPIYAFGRWQAADGQAHNISGLLLFEKIVSGKVIADNE